MARKLILNSVDSFISDFIFILIYIYMYIHTWSYVYVLVVAVQAKRNCVIVVVAFFSFLLRGCDLTALITGRRRRRYHLVAQQEISGWADG